LEAKETMEEERKGGKGREGKGRSGVQVIQNVEPNYVPTIHALAIRLGQKW